MGYSELQAGGDEGVKESVDYKKKLDDLTRSIDSLKSDVNDGDPGSKESMNKDLDVSFFARFTSYIENPDSEEVKTNLVNSITELLSAHKNEENFEENFKSYIELAKILGINLEQIWEQNQKSIEKSVHKKPDELKFQWKMNEIAKPTDEQRNHRTFYSNIDIGVQDDEQSEIEKCESKVSNFLEIINWLLNAWLEDEIKNNLLELKENLENILNVMLNPDQSNTRALQNFIYFNLDEDKKKQFEADNHYKNNNFDGQFGVKTLEWLKVIMDKIDSYIADVRKYLEEIQKAEENKNNEAINEALNSLWNKELTFQKWGTADDFINSLNLPDWCVDFADEKEKAKLNEDWKQDIILKVKKWDTTEDVVVKVNLVSEDVDNKKQESIDKTPFDYNGNKYLVMDNSSELVWRLNIPWVAFYSNEPSSDGEIVDGLGEWNTKWVPEAGDYSCKMVFNDKFGQQNIYEITVDQFWNICPVARNFKSGSEVVFENLKSGPNYLYNKLPMMYKNNPNVEIWWNGDDYYIGFKWTDRYLTIEPMTIDWYWLKDWEGKVDLTDSLSFLLFINFLRNSSQIDNIDFKWDEPDLKLEDNKLFVRVDGKSNKGERWYEIDKNRFWLPEDPGVLRRFVRYNNHEDWNDNWDVKIPNKYYSPVSLH